jgi:hypothetical protein
MLSRFDGKKSISETKSIKTPNLNRKLHATKQIKVENLLDYCFAQLEKSRGFQKSLFPLKH